MGLVAFRELHGHAEVDELVFTLLQFHCLSGIEINPVALLFNGKALHGVVEVLDGNLHANRLKGSFQRIFHIPKVNFHVRTVLDRK